MRKLVIAALTGGILLTMAGLRIADLRWSRDETLRNAELRAANLSTIVSAYLAESFAAGDASLRQLALHSRRVGGPGAAESEWTPTLASAKAGLSSIGAIAVVDRDGIIRHSTRRDIVGQSRQHEFVVQEAFRRGGDDLVVGTPFPTQVEPRQLLIPIGRAITRADGTVEGAVVASFMPAARRAFFRTVDVGHRGIVWVFHPSGIVLFREPSSTDRVGESAKSNPVFQAAV